MLRLYICFCVEAGLFVSKVIVSNKMLRACAVESKSFFNTLFLGVLLCVQRSLTYFGLTDKFFY